MFNVCGRLNPPLAGYQLWMLLFHPLGHRPHVHWLYLPVLFRILLHTTPASHCYPFSIATLNSACSRYRASSNPSRDRSNIRERLAKTWSVHCIGQRARSGRREQPLAHTCTTCYLGRYLPWFLAKACRYCSAGLALAQDMHHGSQRALTIAPE